MRIIKLKETELRMSIEEYFISELFNRNPRGLFIFPQKMIRAHSLQIGDTILFSLKGTVRYVATTLTGMEENTYLFKENYPCCFQIDVANLKPVSFHLNDFEKELRMQSLTSKSLNRQGWVELEENEQTRNIVTQFTGFEYTYPMHFTIQNTHT